MKAIFFYILLTMQFFSCAQVHHLSQKAIGTYTVQMPGNIAVDAAGNELTPRKIIAVIYMETSSKDLIIKNAQLDTSEYSVTQQQVNTLPYMAGINFKSNEKVEVNADKNNFLWRIELAPFPIKNDGKSQLDTITLKGTYQGKSFEQKVANWVELAGIPTY